MSAEAELIDDDIAEAQPVPVVIERRLVEPGWYLDMPNEEYHRGTKGTSSSQLKVMMEQTGAFLQYKNTHPQPSTLPMQLGTAVHTMTLEPHRVKEEIAVKPAGLNLRKNADKAIYAEWKLANAGKILLTEAQFEQAEAMATRVREHETAKLLIEDAVIESSIFWWYRSTDLDDSTHYRQMAKIRPDILCKNYPIVADLKTCADATYTEFAKTIVSRHYDLSAAMYLEGVNQCEAIREFTKWYTYQHFVFICVESEPPYQVALYQLSDEFKRIGLMKFRIAMQRLYDAREQEWPSFPEEVRIIEPPGWAAKGATI